MSESRESLPIIQSIGNLLRECIENLELEGQQKLKITFLVEQLDLAITPLSKRKFSTSLLATSLLWKQSSPALYRRILSDDLLSLPSIRHLQRLSSSFTIQTGLNLSTLEYLKLRIQKLSERERTVALIFDEVYCSKRVEYQNGQIFGKEKEGATSTLLCFMIKSLAGNYRDVVTMIPLSHINSGIISDAFNSVLKAVTDTGFNVVASICDAHAANRKFYAKELCGGELKLSIDNPYKKSSPIFLLFDPTHIFKNFYTNLLNKKKFLCPAFEGIPLSADINHIKNIYLQELRHPIKQAHKITRKVLNPLPVERTNVSLADSFFHESTYCALESLSDDANEDVIKTCNFLKLIRKWWNFVNVKTKGCGHRKRDSNRDELTADNIKQVQFLSSFADWLDEWKASSYPCMSSQTMLAASQTSRALVVLCRHLIIDLKFDYVLLGKAQSDDLEGRFSWYRQMSGGNYYVSVRQFLESEKNIRIRSLIDFNKYSVPDLKILGSSKDSSNETIKNILKLLPSDLFQDFESHDEGAIYYVSGWIAATVLKQIDCTSCRELLQKIGVDCSVVHFEKENENSNVEQYEKSKFFNLLNRGGLIAPSDLLYSFVMHGWCLYKTIFDIGDCKSLLLNASNSRNVFIDVSLQYIENYPDANFMFQVSCSKNHKFKNISKQVFSKLFNVMIKNFVADENSNIHASRKRCTKNDNSSIKIKKLSSE
jgi:hypothetical protein